MSEFFIIDTDMEMPCLCKCGEWFDLHDGKSGKNGQVYCSDYCALEGNEGETLNVCNSCEEVFGLDSDTCEFCGSDDFETQEVLI